MLAIGGYIFGIDLAVFDKLGYHLTDFRCRSNGEEREYCRLKLARGLNNRFIPVNDLFFYRVVGLAAPGLAGNAFVTTHIATLPRPMPPNSSGMVRPNTPRSASPWTRPDLAAACCCQPMACQNP